MADRTGRIAVIPYYPRDQFKPYHERAHRWAILVCHRRAGKTVACINDLIRAACTATESDARFGYLCPLFNQAKDVAWNYLLRFSEPVRTKANESELFVELFNGARIRLYGADNPDRLRGGYFNGIVLDEYADMRPSVWGEVIRPTLADKKGWATFIGTPKGRVGLYDIWARKNQWKDVELFRMMLKASNTGILDEEELNDARRSMTEEQYAQEFECSFEAAILGAVYGKLMSAAERDNRITKVPYDPSALVYTGWDIGPGVTAIWFCQQVGREYRLIDFYEGMGVDVSHYAGILKQKPYNYGGHILPWDAAKKEYTSAKSAQDVLESLGVRPLTILTQHHIEDGINAARLTIPTCVFDETKCERGLEALRQYRYEYDDKLATLKQNPVHDWASHGADAFRYLCEGLARGIGKSNFNRTLPLDKGSI
jgi:phage terminase large subunit